MTEPPDHEADGWAVIAVPLDSEPPALISTEEDDPEPEDPAPAWIPTGPPGGRIFSLAGRPAPGLYLVAWLFAVGGFAVLFMSLLASAEGITSARGAQPLLGVVGTGMLGLGLATAAGYQIVARTATRPEEAYRGPSPAITFGVALLVVGVFALGLAIIGLSPTSTESVPFLANLIAVEAGYALVVWLCVVRSGALTWRQMGWPVQRPLREIAIDAAYGVGLMVPALLAIAVVAAVTSQLLGGVQAPNVVPASRTSLDVVLLGLSAIVVAPIGEELFFRGFALSAWRRDLGVRSALIRSALFFGIIHIVNVQSADFGSGLQQVVLVLVQIIPLGFVLGWLFVRRGIVASIAGHAAYNAVIFVLALSLTKLPNV